MENNRIKSGMWDRVSGPDTDFTKKDRTEANKKTKENKHFIDACSDAGVDPTKRQASKWNHKKGKAYKIKNNIRM